MEAAAKLSISVTISKIGIDSTVGATANVSSNERNNDWQPAYTLDEEGILLQLRNTLVQTLDASMCKYQKVQIETSTLTYSSNVLFSGLKLNQIYV